MSKLSIDILAIRQTDDVHHIFLGANRDRGHISNRGVDCPCEPEINIVNVGEETIRLFIHDTRIPQCR